MTKQFEESNSTVMRIKNLFNQLNIHKLKSLTNPSRICSRSLVYFLESNNGLFILEISNLFF